MRLIKLFSILCLFFLGLIGTSNIFAQQVDVEVNPSEAVVNESFYVTFKVRMSGGGEPYISFTPVNAEVLNRREQGVSISTTVINGKFSTTREQSYVYELISDRSGTVYLRDIKVESNGKTEKVKDIRVNVLSEKRKLGDVFLEAQPSKTKIFIGEGINVNYYLYYKVPVVAKDIKEFPKLNKFIKRFYKTNGNVETVQYKGEVFRRVLAYSARVYPEKPGTAVLDSMKISTEVATQRTFDPFSGMAPSFRARDITSPRVEIEVMSIPSEGMPQNFTGLVGDHDFTLTGGKAKYLINEPIEFKLEVKGGGALENFQASSLFNSDLIEDFDTKADLVELQEGVANKKFEFTYLARSEVQIPEREISFSVFDPDQRKFIEKKIKIPSIIVAGGTIDTKVDNNKSKEQKASKAPPQVNFNFSADLIPSWLKSTNKDPNLNIGLIGPMGTLEKSKSELVFQLISIFLLLASLLIILLEYRKDVDFSDDHKVFDQLFKKFKKVPSYENLYLLIEHSFKNEGSDVVKLLKNSAIENETKSYIMGLLNSFEQSQFSKSPNSASVSKIDFGRVKRLKRHIKENRENN